jgi:hypothetical protein
MANRKLNFRDIDFTGIKSGLIEYLLATNEFKDANRQGSFINELINMFAYTGGIFGNYINSMSNEQYIKTCNLYETANMLGSLVGYKSHGFQSPRATVTVEADLESLSDDVENLTGWTAIFPRNLQFSTSGENSRGKSVIYSNTTDSIMSLKETDNIVSLELIQGIPTSIEYISDGTELQRYEIPNPFIDYRNIRVYVIGESEEELWEPVTTWFYRKRTADSKIYVPYINPKGLVEILFAEGNFGEIPSAGKTIRIEYYVSAGANGEIQENSIDSIINPPRFVSPDDPLQGINGQFVVSQPNASSEGSNIETTSRIKTYAPLYFGVQNRLVNKYDYEYFVLGEYPWTVDAKAFNYEEASACGLFNNKCTNEFINEWWAKWSPVNAGGDTIRKIADFWSFGGFYDAFTVEGYDLNSSDVLPLPLEPKAFGLLNTGTNTGLYVDTTRPCDDNKVGEISQRVEITTLGKDCCTTVHFVVECMLPEIRDDGTYAPVTKEQITLMINRKEIYVDIKPFEFSSEGYVAEDCCCDRFGDKEGWYVVRGVYEFNNSEVDDLTLSTFLNASIIVKPNVNMLIGKAEIYPEICIEGNDVFIVPVPETGGNINIETKEEMLERMEPLKMVAVRNHILTPIYQTFDVSVVFRKDETSILSTEEVSNSIKSTIVSQFLPKNRKLGDTLNALDFNDILAELPGVERVRVQLLPSSSEVQDRLNSLGDYKLTDCEFPILGQVYLQ